MPDALSLTRSELPEEIERAIDALCDAEHAQVSKGSRDADAWCEATKVCQQAREALTAAILSRLGEVQAQVRTQAMEQLAADAGWELGWDRVRAERDATLARVERLESALEPLWQRARAPGADRVPDDGTVTVFMKDCREALAALSEAGRLAIKDA